MTEKKIFFLLSDVITLLQCLVRLWTETHCEFLVKRLIMLRLRLCYLKLNCLFYEKCHLPTSPYRDFTNTLLSGFNVTLFAKPNADEDEAIDECLLSILRNESDAVLLPYTMPVIMSNIKTGPVLFSDKIAFLSTYGFEYNVLNPGIFDTFDAFNVDALTLILAFFVIMVALISLTYTLEHKDTPPQFTINGRRFNLRFIPWFIFCFFVKKFSSFPGNMTGLKGLLTCCLLMFSYFVTFFYSTMIKTDMVMGKVVVKPSRVIASYQDILEDPEIEPYIRNIFDEYVSFKHAPSGSLKRKIWERVVKMGVSSLVYKNNVDIEFLDSQHPFMKTKAVIMVYSSLAHGFKYFFALHLKSRSNRKGLIVIDAFESEKMSASVMNRMTGEVISHKYEGRMRRFFEGHFWHKVVDNMGLQSAEFSSQMLGFSNDISDADEYISQRVLLPESVVVKPNMAYFMLLFKSYLVLFVIQLIVFLFETWVSDKDSNRIFPSEQYEIRIEE